VVSKKTLLEKSHTLHHELDMGLRCATRFPVVLRDSVGYLPPKKEKEERKTCVPKTKHLENEL